MIGQFHGLVEGRTLPPEHITGYACQIRENSGRKGESQKKVVK